MSKRTGILLFISFSVAFSVVSGQWGLENLGEKIERQVQLSLKPLEGLGSSIQQNVDLQVAGLSTLSSKIEEEVNRGLEPVRIMESIMKVRFGTDGTTIATFKPGGQQFVVKNGNFYTCSGTINENNGECSGALDKMQFRNRQDFCYVPSKNVINDWYCFVPNSNYRTISYINGKIVCEASGDGPRLLIKRNDYEEMCRDVATSVRYKYLTNIPLQHVGNGLICTVRVPQVCNFEESLKNNINSVIINSVSQ